MAVAPKLMRWRRILQAECSAGGKPGDRITKRLGCLRREDHIRQAAMQALDGRARLVRGLLPGGGRSTS